MAQGEDLQLKGGTSPKRGAEEGERVVRTGPKRRRLLSDNSQFTNLRIYERHRCVADPHACQSMADTTAHLSRRTLHQP
jgi:hypothetical protein